MTINIRSAAAQDVNAVYAFICELEDESFPFPLFEQFYLSALRDPLKHYLVAEANGIVVGFLSCHGQILLHHMGLVYEIQELFVHKGYRDQKIGRQLLAALTMRIESEDYKTLEVTSNAKRADAHRFYENTGFVRSHYKFVKER